MEIIHLILGKANPGRMNGVNRVVNELATRQHNAGENVQVWGITADPVHDYPERAYTTVLFRSGRNPFLLNRLLKQAIRERKGKAVFHLHGGFIPAMYSAAMLLKRYGIPFVFTPHGSYNVIAMQRSSFSKKIYFLLFEKNLLKAATIIHSLGQSEITGLNALFPNNKSRLIPYGFDARSDEQMISSTDQFVIGFCGRIDIYTKGLEELLKGFRLFHNRHPYSRLWIIGDGEEKISLIRMAMLLGIEDSVVFHGAKYGKEKDDLLKRCHVFAAPSRNEGLPTAVLEAASFGIPCMVTEATNTGDVIRKYDAGAVIPHTDAALILPALTYLYTRLFIRNEQRQIHQNARKMVAQEFNWNSIVLRFHQLYHSL